MTKYILVVLVICGGFYAASHVHYSNLLDFAEAHPKASWGAPVDYYTGVLLYMKDDCRVAQKAFVQLLQDYPKTGYEEKALYYLSYCARVNLDFDTERISLQQYEEDFPSGPDIEAIRKKLDGLNLEHPQP